ncbi:MAG: rhomboid family intramembrane serine protease [Anaerolineae bacterium]|jgi:membrane associated rhomboid family serine protease|nr:rhomboid family intramembrane serine protease [Anaerolineae bacterium]MBT7073127.1 rhomboid family intramembrane serine protease [Anaerolineae bacterium]MBT7326647.1 rhomboid family intramembrane serine protease [Anaerolineae bacterium]
MFPLNDTEPNRYSDIPVMTLLLIFTNALIHFVFPISERIPHLFIATVPAMVFARVSGGFLTGLVSMFLHGGFFHLFGNMFSLWVFGRRVEDACGPWRFLLFYLLVGFGSDLIYVFVNARSEIPVIGASGAVFGVMGAYLILYPQGRIRTLIFWLSFIPSWPRLRAYWVVLYFFALQIIPAMDILLNDAQAGYRVAYWGHLGGFFASVAILLFLRPEAFARYLSDTQV